MSEDEYIKQRLCDQINWYDDKSGSAQKMYKRLRGAEFICAASIPVLAAIGSAYSFVPIVMGVLGAVVVVLASFLSLGQYQENWAQYRTTCESLRHEKYRFLTRTEPYSGENAFSLLVERVESLISKENSEWSQTVRSTEQSSTDSRD
jgi:cytochrome c-type biogenesis protein CcmH/NrfG